MSGEYLARTQCGAPGLRARQAYSLTNPRAAVQAAKGDAGLAALAASFPLYALRHIGGTYTLARAIRSVDNTETHAVTANDGRVTATHNEMRVLRALNRFGWLRTRDLASLLWQPWLKKPLSEPDMRPQAPTASARCMAQRTLRRLYGERQVLRSQAPDGSVIYALAAAGVRRLEQIGVPASTGKDLVRRFSSTQYRHRCISNEIAISGIVAGYRVSTEREIAKDKWIGGALGIAGKKPDVILQSEGRVWWVEVERSRRNATDRTKLYAFLKLALQDDSRPSGPVLLGSQRWAKIIFICSPAFHARLERDLEAEGWKETWIKRLTCCFDELYSFKDISFQ